MAAHCSLLSSRQPWTTGDAQISCYVCHAWEATQGLVQKWPLEGLLLLLFSTTCRQGGCGGYLLDYPPLAVPTAATPSRSIPQDARTTWEL